MTSSNCVEMSSEISTENLDNEISLDRKWTEAELFTLATEYDRRKYVLRSPLTSVEEKDVAWGEILLVLNSRRPGHTLADVQRKWLQLCNLAKIEYARWDRALMTGRFTYISATEYLNFNWPTHSYCSKQEANRLYTLINQCEEN